MKSGGSPQPGNSGRGRERKTLPGKVVVAVFLVVFAALAWATFKTLNRHTPSTTEAEGPGGASLISAEIMDRYHALEARERELDQTVWAKEILAERHEELFVQLWDKLNHTEDAVPVLEEFAFEELRLGIPILEPTLEHEIHSTRLGEPARKLSFADWQTRLARWKTDGWRLETSTWRMRKFTPAAGSAPATSLVGFSAHVFNSRRQERAILRGDLTVTWQAPADAGALPKLQLVDATHLEIVSRPGSPVFQEIANLPVTPEDRSYYVDPLICYDLDGDGVSEIILAGKNLVFWNKNGKFEAKPLCEHPPKLIHTGLIADFTGDGVADFLCADRQGLLLFVGNRRGEFREPGKRVWESREPLKFVEVMTAGDINADGSLDVWLAQYKAPHDLGQMPTPYYDANDGHPSFLLLNDGAGNFHDATESAGLAAKRFRRTYSCSFVDLDGDGHLDLVVVSDFAGVDLYHNDGRGHFTDITERALDERHLFGMAHALGDFDGDGRLDLLAIGMTSPAAERLDHLGLGRPERPDYQAMRAKMTEGNRLYLGGEAGFHQAPFNAQIARTGWSWGVTAFDFDNDGVLDFYIAAGHESKASVRDYEAQFWRHDIYAGNSANDRATEMFFGAEGAKRGTASYGGYYQNQFFLHNARAGFVEAGYLLGVAPQGDSRNLVSDDFNGDGRMDLALISVDPTFQHQAVRLLENRLPDAGNWIGFRLREEGSGFSPVGARVTIATPGGSQSRWLVLGDSFRSQHAPVAHFGLGRQTSVTSVEIRWPNGQTRSLANPAINQYHAIHGKP